MELENSRLATKDSNADLAYVNLYSDYNQVKLLECFNRAHNSCFPTVSKLDLFRTRTQAVLHSRVIVFSYLKETKFKKSPTMYKREFWRIYR